MYLVFTFLSLGMVILIWWANRGELAFESQVVSTPGRVLAVERGPRVRGVGKDIATFTFTDATGQQHTNRLGAARNPPDAKVGDTVTVLYPASQPERAQLRSSSDSRFRLTVIGVVAALFVAVGLAGIWQAIGRFRAA